MDELSSDLPKLNRRLRGAGGDPSQPADCVIVLQTSITLALLFQINVSFICRRVPLPGDVIPPVPLFLRCRAPADHQWPL